MKAASSVLTHIQTQQTILGLTPMLFVATLLGTWVVVLPLIDQFPPAAIPAGVVVAPGLWFYFWRKTKSNPFFERDFTVALRFWRGKRERILVAGKK
tara:strand:- start:3568 stop:3858 length:291 start_codon:yes stop_codon:yes gene_type:complete